MSQIKNQNLMSKIFKPLVKLVLASVAVLAFVVVAIPLPIFSNFQGSDIQLEIKNLAGLELASAQISLKDLPGDWDTLCIISGGTIKLAWDAPSFFLAYLNTDPLLSDNWGLVTFKGWAPKDVLLGSYSQYKVKGADSYIGTMATPALCAKKDTGRISLTTSSMFLMN